MRNKNFKLTTVLGVVTISILSLLFMPITAVAQTTLPSLDPPTNFYIDLINEDDVILIWDELQAGSRVDSYEIRRSEDTSEKPELYATLAGTESSFIDSDVEVGKTYSYQIVATASDFLDGESDIKSIVITSTNVPGEPIANSGLEEDVAAPDTVREAAADLVSPASEDFWENLVAINLILFGFLILIYLMLYSFIVDRRKGKQNKQLESDVERRSRMKLKLKSDHEHPDIVAKAKDSYYGNIKSELRKWLQSD
jgi:hypothetical protein